MALNVSGMFRLYWAINTTEEKTRLAAVDASKCDGKVTEADPTVYHTRRHFGSNDKRIGVAPGQIIRCGDSSD